MNREQEDKIIEQAQGILERRMATETDIKINLKREEYKNKSNKQQITEL